MTLRIQERRARAEGGHRAANRVVDILELVAASREGLALREVSAHLEAPKSSLLPLLRALAARGYLEQTRAGEYRLGAKALELGTGSAAQRELPELARPALHELMRRTGETVFLGTLAGDGRSVVYVDKVESEQIIRYAAGVGDRRPLHATSSGKAILAFLAADASETILRSLPLDRHTERTVTSLPALRAALEEIRRAGVCVSVDELVRGASGVAAPIVDRHGRVVAACSIGGPTDRMRPQLRQLAVEVKAAARAISALLGHRAHDNGKPNGRVG
ncbi:MAG: IclR family transcriptional regulator [Candidatus Rokubacteria bacterium]|nr:IclR family transcriptional regulator [Candidatus Rokubacteria bacterium]